MNRATRVITGTASALLVVVGLFSLADAANATTTPTPKPTVPCSTPTPTPGQHTGTPTPTPTPTPTVTPTPTPTPTPTVTPTPTPTPTPGQHSGTPTPTPTPGQHSATPTPTPTAVVVTGSTPAPTLAAPTQVLGSTPQLADTGSSTPWFPLLGGGVLLLAGIALAGVAILTGR